MYIYIIHGKTNGLVAMLYAPRYFADLGSCQLRQCSTVDCTIIVHKFSANSVIFSISYQLKSAHFYIMECNTKYIFKVNWCNEDDVM